MNTGLRRTLKMPTRFAVALDIRREGCGFWLRANSEILADSIDRIGKYSSPINCPISPRDSYKNIFLITHTRRCIWRVRHFMYVRPTYIYTKCKTQIAEVAASTLAETNEIKRYYS